MPVMNWANGLTALRLLAAPFCAWGAATGQWRLALTLFVLAVLSDLLDGMAARRCGQVTASGGFFDHATDCTFVTATLAGLAAAGWAPWLLVVLIPSAFLQYTLDSGVLAGHTLRTNALGRANGIGYFALPGIIIGREAFGFEWLPMPLVAGLAWILVATTLASMGERLLFLIRIRRPPDQ